MTELIFRRRVIPTSYLEVSDGAKRIGMTVRQKEDGLVTVQKGYVGEGDRPILLIPNYNGALKDRDIQEIADYQRSKPVRRYVSAEELKEMETEFRELMEWRYRYLKGHPSEQRRVLERKDAVARQWGYDSAYQFTPPKFQIVKP